MSKNSLVKRITDKLETVQTTVEPVKKQRGRPKKYISDEKTGEKKLIVSELPSKRLAVLRNSKKVDILNMLKQISYNEFVEIVDLIDTSKIIKKIKTNALQVTSKKFPKLRNPNVIIMLVPDQILVDTRCRYSIEYFAENFFYINHQDKGLIKIPLRSGQKTALQLFAGENHTYELEYYNPDDIDDNIKKKYTVCFKDNRFSLIKTNRQYGKSTIYAIFLSHYILYNLNKTCGILANKGEVAREILLRVKNGYENLPKWMQKGVIEWNKGSIELENGSRIITAGTTSDAFSGYMLNILVIDEISKLPRNIFIPLTMSLFPTIVSGQTGRIIGVSTPLGDNFFKEMWKEALLNISSNGKLGSNFIPLEFSHWDIPERATEEFVKREIKTLGRVGYLQEHLGRFVAMMNILIDGIALSRLSIRNPIFFDDISQKLRKYKDYMYVYQRPVEGRKYVISCDPNESNIQDKDKAPHGIGMHVIDVTDIKQKLRQVACMNIPGGAMNYLELPLILYVFAKTYNNAWIFYENNVAKEVINNVFSVYYYENIYREDNNKLGYRLTKANKPILCKIMKALVENQLFDIGDADTVLQLKTFMDTYKAMSGYPDDMVTSLIGAMMVFLLPPDVMEGMEINLPNHSTLMKNIYQIKGDEGDDDALCMTGIILNAEFEANEEIEKALGLSSHTHEKYGYGEYMNHNDDIELATLVDENNNW